MYQNFTDDKWIEKLISEKKKVEITTQDAHYYTGVIVGMSENSILFLDKFNQELMFYMRDIRRIIVLNNNGKKRGQE